jgi:hypothetical protein
MERRHDRGHQLAGERIHASTLLCGMAACVQPRGQGGGGMTAADSLEGDNTLEMTRLEELHALLAEFHQKQRAANGSGGGDDGVATIDISHAPAIGG